MQWTYTLCPPGHDPYMQYVTMAQKILPSSDSGSGNWQRDGQCTGEQDAAIFATIGELFCHDTDPDSDACEWENLISIFHPDAYIYTTWTGRTHHLDFIKASQAGMDKGAFIMHRCHGISTDINLDGTRAVTKMKATITQRFQLDGMEVDAESDCRFCFFWAKLDGEWRARYVRHWYEKVRLLSQSLNGFLTTKGQIDSCESK